MEEPMHRILLAAALLLAACDGGNAPPPATPVTTTPAPVPETKAKEPVAPAPAPVATPIMTLPADANPALKDPSKATEKAPDTYKVKFETAKGDFVVQVHRDWAPLGADRFYNLVKIGYFDDVAFFRDISGFMVQFGISGYPEVNEAWHEARIPDDPNTQSNTRGKITFATSGKDSRTTQVFINFGDNSSLDRQGFSPFGEVVDDGMTVVDKLYNGYGEGAPRGRGPSQGKLQSDGNAYLKDHFPLLDYTTHVTIVN
jgi:peptidyl-prolyl cis-trans isomerase A (cyclophilin A)